MSIPTADMLDALLTYECNSFAFTISAVKPSAPSLTSTTLPTSALTSAEDESDPQAMVGSQRTSTDRALEIQQRASMQGEQARFR